VLWSKVKPWIGLITRELNRELCIGLSILYTIYKLLRSQDLRVGQVKESYIGLIQENSIENSVQDCLPYILIPNGPCKLFLAYSK